MGWATTLPEFRRLGMRLYKGAGYSSIFLVSDPLSNAEDVSRVVFGLSPEEHAALFLPWRHKGGVLPAGSSPQRVSQHIRSFVKRKMEEAA